jgi:hypothetical protein
MKIRMTRRRGATIAEVLVASAVLLLMLGGVVSIGVQSSDGWAMGTSQVLADDSASSALQAITRDVRDGISCVVNTAKTEATVTLPEINAQGDYDRFSDGSIVRYYLSAGKLYRQVDGGIATVLTRNVTAVRFEELAGKIQLEITRQKQNGNRSATTTLKTQVALRNEPV